MPGWKKRQALPKVCQGMSQEWECQEHVPSEWYALPCRYKGKGSLQSDYGQNRKAEQNSSVPYMQRLLNDNAWSINTIEEIIGQLSCQPQNGNTMTHLFLFLFC